MSKNYCKMTAFSLMFAILFSMMSVYTSFATTSSQNEKPSEVINKINIEDLKKEKVIKTENFKIGNVLYKRNYLSNDDYYITCEENSKTKYYVNLLKVYPLVKYTETVKPEYVSKKLTNKKFVKMYYYKSEHFITTYDIVDTIEVKVLENSKEKIIGHKKLHYVRIEE